MKKFAVTIALLTLILGIISFFVSETRLEEQVLDEWNPTPSTLYPHWNEALNEYNSTLWLFIRRVMGNNTMFRQLFEQGEISELFLELNVTASSPVRVKIGRLLPYPNSSRTYIPNPIFDEKGTNITKIVKVNVDENIRANVDFICLEIANEETTTVNISGYIKLKGKMPVVFHPFYGFGTLMCILGFSLIVYGLLAKPKRKSK